MRISFDLDDTLICFQPGVPHEDRRLPRLLRMEPLRRGAVRLFRDLASGGHELWVYTTSYRGPWAVWWWLRTHGAGFRYVVNQDRHERACGRGGRSKNPARFGIQLHVDDSWGVWLENRPDRNVLVVAPDDPDWADRVRETVAAVAAGRAPPAPPDLPGNFPAARGV